MIKLKRLVFNNIRRYVEEQDIDFEQRSNLVQIDGINHVTGGSSGAAKSTIPLCVDYLFGVSEIPATVLQSRLTKEKGYVHGFFDVDGKDFQICRSMKTGKTLTVIFDGEEISGNTKLAEEKIDEVIKVPRKLFKKIIHKRQGEGGFFLTMTAKETYDFLSKALNLEKYEKAVVDIESDISKTKDNLLSKKSKVDSLETTLKELKDNLGLYNKPEKPPEYDCDTEKLEEEISFLEKSIEGLSQKEETMISKLKKPAKEEISTDNSKLLELQNELKALKESLDKKQAEAKNALSAKRESLSEAKNKLQEAFLAKDRVLDISKQIKENKANLEHLESSKCPTCLQDWLDESRESKISKIKDENNKLKLKALEQKKIMDSENSLKSELSSIEEEIVSLEKNQDFSSLESEIENKNEEMLEEKNNLKNQEQVVENKYLKQKSEYDESLNKIKDRFREDIQSKKESVNRKKETLREVGYKKESYNKTLKEYEESVANLKTSISNKNKDLEKESGELSNLEKSLGVMEESKRLVKNYVLQKFQDTLDVIGENASQILNNVPNTVNTSIYFEGCKENKDGSIKEEISAIISMDGEDNVPYKSFSGGEANSINWAVDLAVIDVIESYGNTGVDFYILDEPFNGLDSVNRFELLEILKNLNNNKRMVIIDHAPELKEMVCDVIKVERHGEISSVTQ